MGTFSTGVSLEEIFYLIESFDFFKKIALIVKKIKEILNSHEVKDFEVNISKILNKMSNRFNKYTDDLLVEVKSDRKMTEQRNTAQRKLQIFLDYIITYTHHVMLND